MVLQLATIRFALYISAYRTAFFISFFFFLKDPPPPELHPLPPPAPLRLGGRTAPPPGGPPGPPGKPAPPPTPPPPIHLARGDGSFPPDSEIPTVRWSASRRAAPRRLN